MRQLLIIRHRPSRGAAMILPHFLFTGAILFKFSQSVYSYIDGPCPLTTKSHKLDFQHFSPIYVLKYLAPAASSSTDHQLFRALEASHGHAGQFHSMDGIRFQYAQFPQGSCQEIFGEIFQHESSPFIDFAYEILDLKGGKDTTVCFENVEYKIRFWLWGYDGYWIYLYWKPV